mmetsp:Transcript_109578/g.285609  ORF Transcript_109578/g.285609 Transcript_109578/m.285609 type:complete len:219 (-) Transcript_109578:263-919(-)
MSAARHCGTDSGMAGGRFSTRIIAESWTMLVQLAYGSCSPCSSSSTHPMDQISIFSVRLPRAASQHSGAMYLGEPPSPSILRAILVEATPICCARPRSQIFAPWAPSRMFVDFRSRCTTRWECRNSTPSATWQPIARRCGGVSGGPGALPKRRSYREPAATSSVTTTSSGGCRQTPSSCTSLGCCRRRSTQISFCSSSRCATPLICLIATSRPRQEPR